MSPIVTEQKNLSGRFSSDTIINLVLTYLAAPGVRAKSWSNEPILRLEVILYALEAGFDGIFGPISCGKE